MTAKHDEDRLLDHDYDGIQEYDNPMPRWWLWIFWATIVFAVLYCVQRAGDRRGQGPDRRLRRGDGRGARSASARARRGPRRRASCSPLSQDPATVAAGKAIFAKNCAVVPRARRRRHHRPQPDRRLLDPRRHAAEAIYTTVARRRARQGHAGLGATMQAGRGRRRGGVRRHAAGHHPGQPEGGRGRGGSRRPMTHASACPPERPRPRALDAQRGRIAPLAPAEALAGPVLADAAGGGVRADGGLLPGAVPPDGRQAAHPARPAAPAVHALRQHLPADRHAAVHAAAHRASRSRSSSSPRCSGGCGAAGPARRRCTWSSCSGRSSAGSRAAGAARRRSTRPAACTSRRVAQVRRLPRCWRCSWRTPSSPTSSASSTLVQWVRQLAGRAPDLVPRHGRHHGARSSSTSPGSASRPAWSRAPTAACSRCCSTGSR